MRSKAFLVMLLLAVFVTTGAATAYTVVLRDGNRMITTKKYEIDGNRALLTLESGTQTWIDLAEIDVEATAEANERDIGTALVVDGSGTRPLERQLTTTQRRDTLADLVRRRQAEAEAQNADSTEPAPNALRLRKTPAGYNDLATLQRTRPTERAMAQALETLLSSSPLTSYKLFQGSRPDRLFVELTTDNDSEVFEALTVTTQAFESLRGRHRDLGAIEVYMASEAGSRAGQFLLDRDNAPLLVNEQMTVEEFFLVFVEF